MKSQLRSITPVHELAVCEAVLRQVIAVAAAENAGHVGQITLQIGPLSGVESELVRLAFPLVAAGTPCEGATILIEHLPIRIRCRICGATCSVAANRLLCADCASWQVDLTSGDELLLARVELLGRPVPAATEVR